MPARWIFVLLLLLSARATTAQESPLPAPLIALTDASQQHITLYPLDGSTPRTLTLGDGLHTAWGFSPDGCRLLYTLTDARGLSQAYSAALDGSDMRALVQYDAPIDQWGVWDLTWSPRGDIIAFTMLRDNFEDNDERQYHIGYVSAEGGAPAFYSVTGREHAPQWSPDGAWLAYISYDERPIGEDYRSTAVPTPENSEPQELVMLNEADLWVVSADAATKYRLTAFSVGSVDAPRWSPDSTRISFLYSPSPANNTFWLIENNPNAKPIQLSFKSNLTLDTAWRPDGQALVASVRGLREIPEARLWEIPLVPDADQTATLYMGGAVDVAYPDFQRFSADGRYLAVRSAYALIVIDTQNGAVLFTLPDSLGNTPPIWSPQGFTGETACINRN